MALFIPHKCPKCFESMTLIQPLDKQDMPKGEVKGEKTVLDAKHILAGKTLIFDIKLVGIK